MSDYTSEQVRRIREALASTLKPGSIEHILVTEGRELTVNIDDYGICIDATVNGARGTWDLRIQPPGDE